MGNGTGSAECHTIGHAVVHAHLPGHKVAIALSQTLEQFLLAPAHFHTHAHADALPKGVGQTILRPEVFAAPFEVTGRSVERKGDEFATLLNVFQIVVQRLVSPLPSFFKHTFGYGRGTFDTRRQNV